MGVLMSRYMNMPATQVRDVMFTTGTNKNPDGSTFDGWTSPDGVPDERYGWGMPDLEKGMYGPGQFLGKLEYNASVTPLDVWTNDISQVALEARKAEDTAWLNFYKQNGINGLGLYNDGMDARGGAYAPLADYELGTSFVVADNDDDPTNHIVSQADAEKWRKEYADARAAAIQEKLDKGLYDGSLVKLGAGTLIMTGDNTYKGGTTVKAGELYGFTESFGSEKVLVSGGKFGLLSSYNDLFTMQGQLASTASHKADVEVDKGGTFVVVAGQNAQAGALVFKDGSQVTVGAIDKDLAQDVYDNDTTATGTVTATTLTGFDKAVVAPNYAFLDLDVTLTANTLTGSLTKNATATYAGYGADSNGRTIGRVIDQNRAGGLYEALPIPTVTKEQVRRTLDSLGSDLYLNADSAGVVNSVSMARTVKNQAQGIGSGRTAKLGDTARLWATATANWGSVDFGHADADSTFHAGLVGAEVDVTANSTVGVFFGAGSSELKGGGRYGKVNSDDLHGGLYGIYRCDALTVNYGLMHTRQERDAKRTLVVGDLAGYNKVSPNASITQVFAEAAYTKLSTASYSLEPYAGLSVMKVKSDGFSERVGNMTFRTGSSSQSIQAANVGVRGSIPVTGGTVIKGDISAMHFFGDSRPEARMILADTGAAKIKGGKLGSMMGVGLGVETSLSKTSKLDVSYVGVYNGDIKSNGIYANLRIGF
jgi:subtilase-type serine protease